MEWKRKENTLFVTFHYLKNDFPLFYAGVPTAAEIIGLLPETKNTEITIQWNKAVNNGAPITHYFVYQRTVLHNGTSLEWIKKKEIKATSSREFVVKNLEKGKDYQFVVTARNKFGEGKKEEEKIKKIKVLGGRCILEL